MNGQRTITYKKLMKLSTEKFVKELDNVLTGLHLYRTADYRILDFKNKTEIQMYKESKT